MANNTTYSSRFKHKRDTAANWEKVKDTFQPFEGELIVVDTAAGATRFKVGRYDSSKSRLLYYGELPFTDEYLYSATNEKLGQISQIINDKAAKSHTHTKTNVGLGNVDNTADADKSVKYATSAGSAASVTGIIGIEHGGTGATTRGDALYNFIVGGVYSGNINDLAIIGTYWLNLSNCQNGPASSGYGTMEVTRSTTDTYLQRFTFYNGMVCYRTFTNGRWYDWRALPDAHTSETLWEGSLKTGTATITNGAKYAYLIVGGWAGNNEDAVTQIIPVGWGTHMRLTSADKWLAYKCDLSGSNTSITILNNPSGGSIAWVWGVNRYKE